MTKQTGERVGGIFGTVEVVDVPENDVGWGPFLRVHISLDITKPIPRGSLVTFSFFGQMWVAFKYERLPWLCFSCGILGHLERDCLSNISRRNFSSSIEGLKQYGAWLGASDMVSRRPHIGGGRSLLHAKAPVQSRGV